MKATADVAEQFWLKVDKTGACWLWTGATSNGYGKFHAGPLQLAHRFAYQSVVGPIPEGLELDHLCRVRACVNPEHLEPVTHHENLLRGNGFTGRHARATHCPQGHPYDEVNTYRARGRRYCRTCTRDANRRRYHRQKSAAPTLT